VAEKQGSFELRHLRRLLERIIKKSSLLGCVKIS
jgi:hypothetical protein